MNGNINDLLARYMEGETTQEEQRLLDEYFRETDPLPAEMKPYKQMFDFISQRPEVPTAKALERFAEAPSPLPLWGSASIPLNREASTATEHSPKGGAGRRLLLAAACIAALAFILHMPSKSDESLAIAYIDGKMLRDKQMAMQMGEEALQEIFSNGNQEQQLSELFNEP